MKKIKFKGATTEILNESKILIIEDGRALRAMLRQLLENYGFKHIYEAKDGKEGWEKTLELNPDLVLLDINMPVMDGFAYCKMARANPAYQETAILVQTGLTELNDKAKIFEAGATDYVTKPLDYHEIAARSFIHLERARHIRELESFNLRVKEELKAAKNLIEISLPHVDTINSLKDRYKIDLAAEFKSSMEMGGDFWGFSPLNNEELSIYCLDFSGHGLDSALNAMRLHSIMHTNVNKPTKPGELLAWLNNTIRDIMPRGHFATMFYGVVNIAENTIVYAVAASTSPVILYKGKLGSTLLDGRGFPLGTKKDASYETHKVPFNAGDTLILYSDALFEAEDADKVMLGEEKLVKMFENFHNEKRFNSQKVLKKFLSVFHKKYGENLNDDMTINIYHRMD